MRPAYLVIASITVTAVLLTGCERPDRNGTSDRSDERAVAEDSVPETVKVGTFDKIDLRGAAQLTITVGPAPSVELQGSRRSVKRIDVTGDTLHIDATKTRGWFDNRGSLKVLIHVPALNKLDSNGASEIKITGLSGGEQVLRLAGAHDVHAEGRLDKLDLEVSGAGNVDYGDVVARDADVVVNGAGNVDVQVTDTLHAEVNGVGAVRYSGEPKKVESALHGLGTISQRHGTMRTDNGKDKANDNAVDSAAKKPTEGNVDNGNWN